MRYRTVLFDVGETLLGPRESFGATYARVLAPMGLEVSAEEFEVALRASWGALEKMIPPGTDRYGHFPGGERGYWLRFAKQALDRVAGEPVSEEFAERALDSLRDAFKEREAWEVFADVRPTLESLRKDGLRLGVVSNWDSRLPKVLEKLGLSVYFDAITVSGIERVEKPDAAIFHRALEMLDGRPETAVHVGDLPEIDLAGARAAGIRGILVDRRGRLDPSLAALPDLTPLPHLLRN